jgi:hypothetical protein
MLRGKHTEGLHSPFFCSLRTHALHCREKIISGKEKGTMLAAPLSYLLDSEPDWSSAAMPSDRKCVTCGDFTATKRGNYCTAHTPSTALAKKKASLANLEALPEASQPQSTIVSLSNEIRALERLAGEEKSPEAPADELFRPRSGSWSGSEKAPSEAAEPATEPSSPQGPHQGLPAQEVPEEPVDSTEELSNPQGPPQGLPQGLPAQEVPEEEPSKRYANKLRRELREGKTSRGQPLTEEQAQMHIAKLHRMLVLPARYKLAELVRINELERRFIGHLVTVVNTVNAHTTAALEPPRDPLRRSHSTAARGPDGYGAQTGDRSGTPGYPYSPRRTEGPRRRGACSEGC